MRARHAHAHRAAAVLLLQARLNPAGRRQRRVVLRRLVAAHSVSVGVSARAAAQRAHPPFGQVSVEVVLPIKLGRPRDGAVQRAAEQQRLRPARRERRGRAVEGQPRARALRRTCAFNTGSVPWRRCGRQGRGGVLRAGGGAPAGRGRRGMCARWAPRRTGWRSRRTPWCACSAVCGSPGQPPPRNQLQRARPAWQRAAREACGGGGVAPAPQRRTTGGACVL